MLPGQQIMVMTDASEKPILWSARKLHFTKVMVIFCMGSYECIFTCHWDYRHYSL